VRVINFRIIIIIIIIKYCGIPVSRYFWDCILSSANS